ncbi:MAG: hypothetical protein EAX86_01815 [Candidatus Heimdallarchaeota archaeon]|nr:hypothetical protein [Candidatus Heimdallarchaeota archaeon]
MVKRKKSSAPTVGEGNQRGTQSGGEKTSGRTEQEAFLGACEIDLINCLKQLSSLPSQGRKEDDPLTPILLTYARKWRAVEK